MTKRIKSSDLVRARKETKRLQRETQTRIRKATRKAMKSGDTIQLQKIEELKKNYANTLSNKSNNLLPKSFKNNVMRERGRAIQLKYLSQKTELSQKKQKRQTRRTFDKLFGKDKTKEYLKTIGGSQMSKMSSEFWEQMYKAQDMLFALGIVPADEIMGKWGSIGSGLLDTGKQIVDDGFWEDVTIELGDSEATSTSASTDVNFKVEEKKIKTEDLASAIVEWYKKKYGIE